MLVFALSASMAFQNWRTSKPEATPPDSIYFKYKAAEADANSLKAALKLEEKNFEDFKRRTKIMFDQRESEIRFQKQQIEAAVKLIAKLKQIPIDQVRIDL